MLMLWLALQAGTLPTPPAVAPVDFDLGRAGIAIDGATGLTRCQERPGEIVVCGRRRGNDYPMEKMARRYRWEPPKPEIGLGGGATARAYVDQVELPQGQVSRRVMFGVKLPF